MARTPFRRRGKLGKAARNLAIADAALALARDKMGGGSHRKRGRSAKLALLGGATAAAVVGALWKREKVAALLPSRSESGPEPWTPSAPGPSNYDAPGPVANTATPVPAPEPQAPPAVDESAEEAAAAAEAASIGGTVSEYGGVGGEPATEAELPLAEAGEGEAEGQEQAERGLERAAEPTAPGVSDAERQIDDTIEAAATPAAGETVEPVAPTEEPGSKDEAAEDPKDEDDSGGSDWQTWSGPSVKP
jgi:hypothetical protein